MASLVNRLGVSESVTPPSDTDTEETPFFLSTVRVLMSSQGYVGATVVATGALFMTFTVVLAV